jgi:hypothetical protein
MLSNVVSTPIPRVYDPDPSGRCIYCGSSGELAREHIIAHGLGGGLILLKASCSRCGKITGKVENTCLHEMFLAYRTHFALPTYRKKSRPTSLPVALRYGTHRVRRYVPIKDHPHVLILPKLMQPGIMIGLPPGPAIKPVRYDIFGDVNDIRDKIRRLGAPQHFIEASFDLIAFVRMLAKSAHALAVAELGLDGFEHKLPALILGEDLSLAAYLIGDYAASFPMPKRPPNHQVAWGLTPYGADWNVFVRIRLFSVHPDTPGYCVIVGRLMGSATLASRHGPALKAAMTEAGARQFPEWLCDAPH